MSSIAFERLSKTYPGGFAALSELSLEIADGELLVVVGPSGCGKSTLLRLLAGLDQPTGGSIRIGATNVDALSPAERNVAMVFQDYALYPTMTVRGNLEFPLKMRRMGGAERKRRIERVAGMLDLLPLLDHSPAQLSGGQRQRVAMGRALVREPAVFLLDEPLANLDARLRAQVRAEIAELQRRTGTTMIYVTHDQVEAMTLGQRIAVLDRGRLQQAASPRELYARPVNTFVAGFIGNPPMNLLPVRVERPGEIVFPSLGHSRLLLGRARAPQQAAVAGIRPEAVRLAGDPAEGIDARVQDVEYLGHETLLHFAHESGPACLIGRLPGLQPHSRGDAVRLTLAPEDLHFFDRSGQVLA
ncbi:ABC transporter ATP-binding protein [Methylococcus geothermalis]|uniref:ATP-binding cassette domain-containing protein n=1 Tax=Methylococcus geothermalis TaxID=2681310 RepID=A0A858Q9N6_9GAMM|nr:ATP-binding cassette domain-containing protein [Methylococcus geothermalis]QJD30589.1 ATP-binding cassette domain-containing protein [Methylococcus geothermalis]